MEAAPKFWNPIQAIYFVRFNNGHELIIHFDFLVSDPYVVLSQN